MNKELINKIREKHEKPIIGIIGASAPDPTEYNKLMGLTAGYKLREYVEQHGGTLFTGGVSGVGVDSYEGIIQACQPKRRFFKGKPKDDKFFVLIPKCYEVLINPRIPELGTKTVLYHAPAKYQTLAKKSFSGKLEVVCAGEDMCERREYVYSVGDAFVVLNGGFGTLEEALGAVSSGKPIISLSYTNGAAKLISDIKEGKQISHFDSSAIKSLGHDLASMDLGVIHPAESIDIAIKHLNKVLQ